MPAAAPSPEVLAKYEPVIGLEVHVQLLTATKAFCVHGPRQFLSSFSLDILCDGLYGSR